LNCNVALSQIDKNNIIKGDYILVVLESNLKGEWNLKCVNDTLFIISTDTMWLDFYNIAGAPFDDPEYKKYTEEYIKTKGQKLNATMLLKLVPKWDSIKLKNAVDYNTNLYKKIDSLIYKYNISHLNHSYRWDEEIFWNTNDEEKLRVEEYKKEKNNLISKIIIIPQYSSEKYSLFTISRNWLWSETSHFNMLPMIFPESESLKIIELVKILSEILHMN
jgi:hypothetical protein